MKENIYRAYDTTLKKMIYDGDFWLPSQPCKLFGIEVDSDTCYPVKVTNHGIAYTRKLDTENYRYVMVCDVVNGKEKACQYHDGFEATNLWMGEEIILMQYTNCEDNKKNKIFADDIITHGWEGKQKWRVIWHQNLAAWYLEGIGTYDSGVTHSDFALMATVIGNAHENPELLEAEN
jgi:hypothetical protein